MIDPCLKLLLNELRLSCFDCCPILTQNGPSRLDPVLYNRPLTNDVIHLGMSNFELLCFIFKKYF